MKVDTFFENFELLTDAPNAVGKLRELILQLAVRGKLVAQNDDDQPASSLLEKIEIEKRKLIKEKKLKKIETIPVNEAIHFLYRLPKQWTLIRLGGIVQKLGAGSTPLGGKNVYVDSGIKFLRSQNVWNDGIHLDEVAYITPEIHQKMSGTVVEAGDILLNITGASIGRCAVVPDDFDEGNVSQHVSIIRLINKDLRQYIHLCIISSLIQNQIMEVQVGISREGLSMNRLKDFLIPLPPLAEQKRIVEKCDRLLSICDDIEKRQQQRQESVLRMNESAIAKLLSSQNPDEFRQHWQRICNNFDLLYSVPETIPKLRQAILQLAVQGKLTNQSSKEFKKTSDRHKVSDYVSILNGYAFKSTWFIDDGIRLLRNANVGHGDLRWDDVARISKEREQEFQRFKLDINDIVISLDRPIISTGLKVARITKNDLPCLLLQRVGKFEFKTDEVIPEFFFLWLQSPIFIEAIDPGRSNGVPHISSKSIEAIPFNPPSREEQKRIVEKCNVLMSLCDTLEAKLKQARDSSEKLMEIAAKQVLEA